MNSKEAKVLRRRAREIIVEWLKTLVSPEEAAKITVENFDELIPEDTHYYAGGQLRCYAMSPRYVYKKLKKNPDITIEELISNAK